MKKKIVIIDQSDFINSPVGGSTTFLRTIVPQLTIYYDVYLIGRTADRSLIGKWTNNYLGNTSFYGTGPTGEMSKIIPNRIKTIYYLFISRKKILMEKFDIYYFHQVETVIPFLGYESAKKVLHIHGLANPLHVSRFNVLRNKVFEIFYNFFFKIVEADVDGIISVSYPNCGDSNEILIGRKQIFKHIPICIDPTLFRPEEKTVAKLKVGVPSDIIILGYIGRLSKKKGIEKSLHTVKYFKDRNVSVKFLIVGNGEYKHTLMKMCINLGIDGSVLFVPSKEYESLSLYYNAMDVFLMSSEAEGLPMVILEALACGVPVIATDVGAIRNIIKDGYNGYVVKDFINHHVFNLTERIISNYKTMSENASVSVYPYHADTIARTIALHMDKLLYD